MRDIFTPVPASTFTRYSAVVSPSTVGLGQDGRTAPQISGHEKDAHQVNHEQFREIERRIEERTFACGRADAEQCVDVGSARCLCVCPVHGASAPPGMLAPYRRPCKHDSAHADRGALPAASTTSGRGRSYLIRKLNGQDDHVISVEDQSPLDGERYLVVEQARGDCLALEHELARHKQDIVLRLGRPEREPDQFLRDVRPDGAAAFRLNPEGAGPLLYRARSFRRPRCRDVMCSSFRI